MEFTPAQRAILLNLFEIREALAGDDADVKHWAFCADIARYGYESLYDKLPGVSPPMPEDRGHLVREIGDVFVALGRYMEANPGDTKASEHRRARLCFDGNGDERDMMGFLRFIMDRNGEFSDLAEQRKKTDDFNNHGAGPSVSEYGAMVGVWKSMEQPSDLSPEQAHAILDAQPTHPGRVGRRNKFDTL